MELKFSYYSPSGVVTFLNPFKVMYPLAADGKLISRREFLFLPTLKPFLGSARFFLETNWELSA